jgi:hypothetical protein
VISVGCHAPGLHLNYGVLQMTKPIPAWFRPATRTLGAVALLVVGGVHYQQYRYDFYSAVPTIGPLFLANFVAATVLGLFLLSPRRAPGRLGTALDRLAALVGVGVAAGAFVGLLVSEHTPLFGFSEHGYRFAIVLALVSEAVAMVMLALFLIGGLRRARLAAPPSRRGRSGDRDGPILQDALALDPKR